MPNPYTTRQGDTWDIIAYRLWGRETLMDHLVKANPEHLGTLVFRADIELQVPHVSVPAKVAPKLPPWMGQGEESS